MRHCAARRTPRSTADPAGRSWPTLSSNVPPVVARRCRHRSRSTWSCRTAHCLSGDTTPANLSGYGPIPAEVARGLVSAAATDSRSRATLRRLYSHPRSGALVAMESRARRFPRGLATFIGLRDDRCRTPYCDAPIRHRDHATPHNRGGPTAAANGLGLCERCNYVKENAGWRICTHIDETGRHTAEYLTPTGGRHRSTAPPCASAVVVSELEVRVGISLAQHAA